MEIIKPDLKPELLADTKTKALYDQLQHLLNELDKKKISEETVQKINSETAAISATSLRDKDLYKMLKQKQTGIIKLLEKNIKSSLKLLPQFMAGCRDGRVRASIGVAFGLLMGNIALLSIGLPIGMGIGVAVGTSLDKKLKLKEGN